MSEVNRIQSSLLCYINNELIEKPATAIEFVNSLHASKEAQEKYKKTDLIHRADVLQRFAELISLAKADLVQAESRESGLPIEFCFQEIIDPAQKYIENLSLELRLFPKPESLLPTGVVGITGPRTLTFLFQATWIANCLATANAVILKPNSETTGSSIRIAQILKKLDLPVGLVQILNGEDKDLNPLMAGHPGINAFLYSGSFQSAEALIQDVAKRKKKAQFFLGAKNSALIHPEFDFKKNLGDILRPALIGMGQLEVNTHRFFISQSVEKDFYESVQTFVQGLDAANFSPFLSKQRRELFEASVARVIPEEGKILFDGPPTFTRDLPNCSDLQQDEIPGPLFIVTAVKYTHEMVKWSNTGYLGHSAIVWGPEDKARNLSSQLQVGQVLINRWGDFADWGVPTKQSFWGNPDIKWSGTFYSNVKKVF
jgi:acyl-CoA reductase-like NAD-dependent aldehyde dehydrogenase